MMNFTIITIAVFARIIFKEEEVLHIVFTVAAGITWFLGLWFITAVIYAIIRKRAPLLSVDIFTGIFFHALCSLSAIYFTCLASDYADKY